MAAINIINWLPMESAPRNGNIIVIHTHGGLIRAHFKEEERVWCCFDWENYVDVPDGDDFLIEWYEDCLVFDANEFFDIFNNKNALIRNDLEKKKLKNPIRGVGKRRA